MDLVNGEQWLVGVNSLLARLGPRYRKTGYEGIKPYALDVSLHHSRGIVDYAIQYLQEQRPTPRVPPVGIGSFPIYYLALLL